MHVRGFIHVRMHVHIDRGSVASARKFDDWGGQGNRARSDNSPSIIDLVKIEDAINLVVIVDIAIENVVHLVIEDIDFGDSFQGQ